MVDDETDILESTKDYLEASLPGTRVVGVLSGEAGLAYLAGSPADLIISDFRMPGMDGIEFLVNCRRLYPRTARVMHTAYASDALAERALREAVVDAFVPKAGSPDRLVEAVAKLVAPGRAR